MSGQTLSFYLQASDADLPPQTLVYGLGAGAPAGATVNPATGLFSWTPTAGQAPSTNLITVTVTDTGTPPLSDSQDFHGGCPFRQPASGDFADSKPGGLCKRPTEFHRGRDRPDLPPQTLTFSLGAGAPFGATITTDGVFNWTPTPAQAPSTNTISVIVRDSGAPQTVRHQQLQRGGVSTEHRPGAWPRSATRRCMPIPC